MQWHKQVFGVEGNYEFIAKIPKRRRALIPSDSLTALDDPELRLRNVHIESF